VRDLHLRLPQGVPVLGGREVNAETFAFLVVGAGTFVSGAFAITSREIVHTIIYIGAFFAGLATIYFLLQAPFLGLLQLAVYAGAVTILLMFAVMVLRKRIFAREARTALSALPILLALLLGLVLVDLALRAPAYLPGPAYGVGTLSQNLFLVNGGWLLLLGLVMLSALTGGVYLARETRSSSLAREARG